MKNTIILGYGNLDRGDDGAAWVTLSAIACHFGHPLESDQIETGFIPITDSLQLWLNLQLIPELAEDLAGFERAVFVDAHTEEIKEDFRVVQLQPEYQNSPFTHHLTPASCLSFCKELYGKCPQSILVSIRGYDFGFSRQLSPKTNENMKKAVQMILDWLEKDELPATS
jgi:hydrogenase maturation protease